MAVVNRSDRELGTTALKAEYITPEASKIFAYALPSSKTDSVREKRAYLSALRGSIGVLQDEVNAFLTAKMEEDKGLALKTGVKMDDRKDEETYGEEIVEDED